MRQKIVKISITFSDCLLTNTYNSDAFLPLKQQSTELLLVLL